MSKIKDQSNAPWQIGALVTIAVAVIGALASIYSHGGVQKESNEKSDEGTRSIYEGEVTAALNSSRMAVDEAFTKLDPEPLKKSYSGDALKLNVDAIRRFREEGVESVGVDYRAIRIDGIDIFKNPLHARVRETVEKTFTIHQGGKCERTNPFESKVTIYLKQTNAGAWLIYAVDEDSSNPSYVPCS